MKPICWNEVKRSPTQPACWFELLQSYLSNNLPWQVCYTAEKLYRLDPSLALQLKGMAGNEDWQLSVLKDPLFEVDSISKLDFEIHKAVEWVKINHSDWLTWLYLARLYDFVLAEYKEDQRQALENATRCEPIAGETNHLMGLFRLRCGDAQGALDFLKLLVDLRPLRCGSMMLLGEALLRLGNAEGAEKAFSRASFSNNPKFLSRLAEVAFQSNYWREAIEILQKGIGITPEDKSLWQQLANIQLKLYQLPECRYSLKQIQRLGSAEDGVFIENALLGHSGEAKASFERLVELYRNVRNPNSRILSSVLMTALYQDELCPEEVANLHKSLCADLPVEVARAVVSTRLKKPKVAIRVGYVTGDLHRQHPVNIFMLPLLIEQQKSTMQVYIYHTGSMYDAYTEKARSCADAWVEAAMWDDARLSDKIVSDEIDILIDLSGHTASHRLGVFLMRSAPVQVTFLGYPHSTGLPCMDYLIGDFEVSPADHAHLFTERIARLESSVFCWAPVEAYPLPTPRIDSDPIVFGSFNNVLKLSPTTIELWADVLKNVLNSKLLLKAPSFTCKEVVERFVALFESHGIEKDRLEFRGPCELSAMMQEYGDVDIALDPLTYNGGTTSLQALWMGVPLVTMRGGNFVSRMGSSFLKTLGKTEWIATSHTSYVEIASSLANDVKRVRSGRLLLRSQLERSRLCDIKKYAANFEHVLRSMLV